MKEPTSIYCSKKTNLKKLWPRHREIMKVVKKFCKRQINFSVSSYYKSAFIFYKMFSASVTSYFLLSYFLLYSRKELENPRRKISQSKRVRNLTIDRATWSPAVPCIAPQCWVHQVHHFQNKTHSTHKTCTSSVP